MQRIDDFETGNFYHIYNRGVDKRKIFFSKGDWKHFQKLLYIRNSERRIDIDRVKDKNCKDIDQGETLVEICAYAMMDNHFHLLVREKKEGGISKFMNKFLTSYAMYMNKKYDRSGPMMCRPFRSKLVDDDEYLRWLISYIHLNPLDMFESKWDENGIGDYDGAIKFLQNFEYSSYKDYFGKERDYGHILKKGALPINIDDLDNLKEMLKEYSNGMTYELGES